MIFVFLAWILLVLTLILVRVWMQSPLIHSMWPRVRNMSSALLTASAFFFLLHFTSSRQENEMQDSLLQIHSVLRDEVLRNKGLLSNQSLYRTRNESVSQNVSRDNATDLSLEKTIIHDTMEARLGI